MSAQKVATRYAKALSEIAIEKGKLDRVCEDVNTFNEVLKNRDFALMLKSPIIKSDTKWKVMQKLFAGKYDDLTMTFFDILLRKKREHYLAEIASEFINMYKDTKRISTVKLTTAAKLSDDAVKNIHKVLSDSPATYENIELITKIKPELIGGFIIEFEDKLYDASVAHKLNALKKEFKDNLYISQIIAS